MAKKFWIGGKATAVAQVDNATPANVEITDIFTLTLSDRAGNAKTLSFVATAATVQNVVEGLQALADAETTLPWSGVTTTEDDTKVIVTSDTAGEPFQLTATATDGGGADTQTLTVTTPTPCAGPFVITSDANWISSSGAATVAPVDTDEIVMDSQAETVIYGYDFSDIQLVGFTRTVDCAFGIGSIGFPLKLDADSNDITIDGRGNVYLEIINADNIFAFGSGDFYCSGIDNSKITITKTGGKFYGAQPAADVLEADDFLMIDGRAILYAGVTNQAAGAPDLEKQGGEIESQVALNDITSTGGILTQQDGAVASLNETGGTTIYNSADTLTAASVRSEGLLDMSKNTRPKTITTLTMYPGGAYSDPYRVATITNGKCNIRGVEEMDLGKHFNFAITDYT